MDNSKDLDFEGNDVDTGSESEDSKEPGRLTAFIIRRDKARLEQQYINAQSFLQKTEGPDSPALIEETNLRAPEESSIQLSTYAREAEEFLDKAFDDTIDDEELVLDGRSSEEDSSGFGSYGSVSTLPDDPKEKEDASVQKTLADLQRYAEEYEDFLSKELGDDLVDDGDDTEDQITIGTGEIPRFPDMPSSLDLEGNSNASFPGEDAPSILPRGPSAILSIGSESNLRRETKYSFYGREENASTDQNQDENNHSDSSELEEGNFNRGNMRLYLNEVQSLIGRNKSETQPEGSNEIMDAYNIMRKMVDEAEDTVDLLERDNFCLKQLMDSYRKKYEEVLQVYSKTANSKSMDNFSGNEAIKKDLELTRIEVDEAKMVIASLERKLNNAQIEIAMKDYHLKNQESIFFSDVQALMIYIKQLSVELETEKRRK